MASTTAHGLAAADAGRTEGLRTIDRLPFGSPSDSSSQSALAASRKDGESGELVIEGGEAAAAFIPAENQQQQQQQESENMEGESGFRVDAHASLEASAESPRTDQRAAVVARGDAFGAPVAGSPEDVALAPVTPLGRLVRLFGELADGGKVTLEHAVAALNGDGKALAVLVRSEARRGGGAVTPVLSGSGRGLLGGHDFAVFTSVAVSMVVLFLGARGGGWGRRPD